MKYLYILILSFFLITPVLAENNFATDLETGSSQSFHILDANQTDLDPGSNDITVQMWVKPESPFASKFIMSKHEVVGNQRSYYLEEVLSGKLQFAFYDDGTGASISHANTDNVVLTTGTWTHITVVVDVSVPLISYYINGTSSPSSMSSTNGTSFFNTSEEFRLGAGANGASSWDGMIDDFRFYDYKLTEDEIATYYNCELTGHADEPQNLVSNWLFENNAEDETDTNDLTENNSPVYATSSLPYTDVCDHEEPATATASTTVPLYLPDIDDLMFITGYTEHYDGTSTDIHHYHQRYIYLPFLFWLILATICIPVFTRIILEIIIRLRQ